MKKKKLSLKNLEVTSFVTDLKVDFDKETIKGGGSDLWNPCGATEPATCANGCVNVTDRGCGGPSQGCPTQANCPTQNNCPSRPPACSDLISPCAGF